MPWMEANGISIHYELAGAGPSLVLLHEMGGTLDSWDGIFPALSKHLHTLRYDQRGSGLSEKARRPVTTELLVEDLEAMLQGTELPPPYHFVTVAAATIPPGQNEVKLTIAVPADAAAGDRAEFVIRATATYQGTPIVHEAKYTVNVVK